MKVVTQGGLVVVALFVCACTEEPIECSDESWAHTLQCVAAEPEPTTTQAPESDGSDETTEPSTGSTSGSTSSGTSSSTSGSTSGTTT